MFNSAQDMYRYFLSEIRKERTVVVSPERWTKLINSVVLDWIKTKLPEREFNEKRIDDLESIKIVTDNIQYPIIELADSDSDFSVFKIPYNGVEYPKYFSGISASFCYDDVSTENIPDIDDGGNNRQEIPDPLDKEINLKGKKFDCIGGRILKSDMRVVYQKNPYRRPDDKRFIYFELKGGYVYAYPEKLKVNRLVLEYYCYPKNIIFDGQNDDLGSFKFSQNKEIVDMAVTEYLEMAMNPRVKTQPSLNAAIPK